MTRKLTKNELKRRKFLLRNHNLLIYLYPGTTSIYGPYLCKDGRYRVHLKGKGVTHYRQYAKVKMEIKLERRIYDPETVDHINDNSKDDRYINLQILTRKENIVKGHKTGTLSASHLIKFARSKKGRKESRDRLKGELNPQAKFTNKQVIILRKEYENGMSIKDIMKRTGISKTSIKNMLSGRYYSHIPVSTSFKFRKYSDNNTIFSLYQKGLDIVKISKIRV